MGLIYTVLFNNFALRFGFYYFEPVNESMNKTPSSDSCFKNFTCINNFLKQRAASINS